MTHEKIVVGDTIVINPLPADSVDEVIERYGFHPAQIVQNASGSEAYSVVRVLRDVWFQAMWRAHSMSEDEITQWLARKQ